MYDMNSTTIVRTAVATVESVFLIPHLASIEAVSYTHLVSGFSIEKNEMKTFDGQPIIYYETKAQLTDDMIDIMIENGSITESDIDAVGGRDALMAIGETDQIGISAIVDGKIVMVTGTYYDNSDDVMEAMKLLLKTGKVS